MPDPQWLGILITCAVYLAGGGVFVGVVRTAIKSLTEALNRLEKRMDAIDGSAGDSIGKDADHEARIKTLEREMREIRSLRDLVVRQDERQAQLGIAVTTGMRALEERIAGAVAMINNIARREGAPS